MTFNEALEETRKGNLLQRKSGVMVLFLKRDEFGFLKSGIIGSDGLVLWFSGARLHDDDVSATNWEVVE